MGDEKKQIGWQVVPIYEKPNGSITTMAFIFCCECKQPIASVGGPMDNAYCMRCLPEESETGTQPTMGDARINPEGSLATHEGGKAE